MSWYDQDFRKRAAVTVINTGGLGTIDFDLVVPADWDEFWDANPADTTGLELRLCNADGYTLLPYSVDNGSGGAFSRSSRLGRIRVDTVTVPATTNAILLFWLYFYTSSVQGSAAVATAIASPETAYVDRGSPTWFRQVLQPQRPGISRPRVSFGKDSADAVDAWLDFTPFLEQRRTPFQKRFMYEEPRAATLAAEDSSGVNAPTLVDPTKARWVETWGPRGRRMLLRTPVTGGTTATNYTIKSTVTTRVPLGATDHRTHKARFGLRVKDAQEVAA